MYRSDSNSNQDHGSLPTVLPNELYHIDVTAHSQYVTEQSEPGMGRYAFVYKIKLRNTGAVAAQLLTRHWQIDTGDEVEHIDGEGVLGIQPQIAAGEEYEYVSGTVIDSPVAVMSGHYQMQAADGALFKAIIPAFVLAIPRKIH